MLKSLFRPWLYWSISVSFVLFQFFLQLSSGIVLTAVMRHFLLSASEIGILASAFYYTYASLQIPVGILFDKKNSRLLLAANAALCTLGCFLFSANHDFYHMLIARLMMGSGSAFAFIGVSHILRQHFPPKKFGFMMGLSETLAFLATVIFMLLLGTFSQENINPQGILFYSGLIGFFLSIACFLILPNEHSQKNHTTSHGHIFKTLLKSKIAWANGLFVGLGFSLITVFGALWAIPFIQLKTGVDLKMASILDALFFLGAALGCPIYGELDTRSKKRRPLLYFSYFSSALLLVFVLYAPITSTLWMGLLLLLLGVVSSGYMAAYTIANEIAPPHARSTSTGFTNTLAVLTAPLLQPLVGYVLDFNKIGSQYTAANYQLALLIVAGCLCLGGCLVFYLPEKSTTSTESS